ncbi:MAG TPA: hypothetical protein DCP91_09435 [Eggerthellaceae bacterium]|nr:hypothetical protein [Eggerthellaceae bacterium]
MEAAEQLVNSVLDTIGGFFNDMFNAGANLIQGLIDGILSGLKPLGDALGNVGQFIVDHKGPPEYDKVMLTPAGADIVGGLIKGMDGELPQLKSAVGRINGVLTAQASSTVRTLPGGMQVLGGGGNVKAAQMLTVILELDKTPFARAVYQLNDEETQRVGVKLAGGFA